MLEFEDINWQISAKDGKVWQFHAETDDDLFSEPTVFSFVGKTKK